MSLFSSPGCTKIINQISIPSLWRGIARRQGPSTGAMRASARLLSVPARPHGTEARCPSWRSSEASVLGCRVWGDAAGPELYGDRVVTGEERNMLIFLVNKRRNRNKIAVRKREGDSEEGRGERGRTDSISNQNQRPGFCLIS